jgi:hypothetical protein
MCCNTGKDWLVASRDSEESDATGDLELIFCAVRRYLRRSLSLRYVEELLAERALQADHTMISLWVWRYAPKWSNGCRAI